jgi:hypothetical protein
VPIPEYKPFKLLIMSIFNLFYLIVTALVLTFVFTYFFRIRGPWGSFWTFLAVLFLGIWAVSLWITPFGPAWRDIYWLPPLVIGLTLALLLAAAVPSPKAREIIQKELNEPGTGRTTGLILGTFFWLLLIVLILIILAGMIRTG